MWQWLALLSHLLNPKRTQHRNALPSFECIPLIVYHFYSSGANARRLFKRSGFEVAQQFLRDNNKVLSSPKTNRWLSLHLFYISIPCRRCELPIFLSQEARSVEANEEWAAALSSCIRASLSTDTCSRCSFSSNPRCQSKPVTATQWRNTTGKGALVDG